MLEIRGLSARYGGGIVAVRDVSLTVPQGKVVSLIGPNGAGKSTTLNAISGFVRVHAGDVLFEDRSIVKMSRHKRSRMGILQVPEGRAILGPMTVEENLELGRVAAGDRASRSVEAAMKAVYDLFPKLHERRKQLGGTLSGGEQQMLAIGRALVGEPRVLLLDEPSLGLAPVITDFVFEALAQLRSRGMTILLVEQNATRALELSDYTYVLERGSVRAEGPSDALASDHLLDSYLGGRQRDHPDGSPPSPVSPATNRRDK